MSPPTSHIPEYPRSTRLLLHLHARSTRREQDWVHTYRRCEIVFVDPPTAVMIKLDKERQCFAHLLHREFKNVLFHLHFECCWSVRECLVVRLLARTRPVVGHESRWMDMEMLQ